MAEGGGANPLYRGTKMEGAAIARLLRHDERTFRGKTVRLMSRDNEQIGIVSFEEAVTRAANEGEDLVCIAPTATPPVCRIMNYGKYAYEQAKHEKEQRRKQQCQKVKEIQVHPNVNDHDLQTKIRHAVEFLEGGDKVKLVLRYRGREITHQDIGNQVLNRFLTAIEPCGHADGPPSRAEKMTIVMLSPKSRK